MKTVRAELTTIRPGRRLYFRTEQIGPQKPASWNILFLHGTCAASTQYEQLLKALHASVEGGVTCHLYDSIGCGNSPVSKLWDDYDSKEQVSDLRAVLEHAIDASIPTIIVAHSYAPNVVIRCFHENGIPSHVKGCVFLSSSISGGPNPGRDGGHLVFKLPVSVLKCLQPKMSKSFMEAAYHPNTDLTTLSDSMESNNENDMWAVKAIHVHHKWTTREQCKVIHALPIIVLHGEDDKILPKECAQYLADAICAQKVRLIQNSSHQVMQENPVVVAKEIVALMNNIQSL